MAFLKNSILEMLQKEGLQIRYFIVDILSGRELSGKNNSDGDSDLAFYYCFIIIEKTENFKSVYFQNQLKQLLSHVSLVTSEFSGMVEFLNDQTAHFKNEKYVTFLKFLIRENFIFFSVMSKKTKLGLFRDKSYYREIMNFWKNSDHSSFGLIKTSVVSNINRAENILIIKFYDIIITGIFTRKADNTSSFSIPVLSEKINNLTKINHSDWTALDLRDFIFAFDLLPLSIRFTIPLDIFVDFSELLYEARVRVEGKIRFRKFNKHKSYLLIIWPVSEFNERFQINLNKFLELNGLVIKGGVKKVLSTVIFSLYELDISGNQIILTNTDMEKVEADLYRKLLSWDLTFQEFLEKKFSFEQLSQIRPFADSIKNSLYKDVHNPLQALEELNSLIEIQNEVKIIKSQYDKNKEKSYIKLFTKDPFSLSFFIPIFSNMGLDIISDDSYQFSIPGSTVYFFKFQFKFNDNPVSDLDSLKKISVALGGIIDEEASSEPLNTLLLSSSLNIFQLELLKALVSYLVQIKTGQSRVLLKKVLQSNPQLAESLVKIFEIKILKKIENNPQLLANSKAVIKKKLPEFDEKRNNYYKSSEELISSIQIKNLIQNEVYFGIRAIIENITRTNYFSTLKLISFKISASNIEFVKKPAPLFEIWVYHPHFEGIHLRGGLISRGGIRWSDRPDDFRTEIWGLWKTQVLKNTIIVPTGAKGGFVLKYITNIRDNALKMYKIFVQALISLTDNLEKRDLLAQTIPVFDDYDNYLVVAADKGTAAFSDFANEISLANSYWLGDAFASGGINGYSHKALGITAKGAWESGKWHLHRLNIDPFRDTFTVTGIGDMSGDVFGNGMIYTSKIKLIGAFNHKHIFLDPEPDNETSFAERLRLFSAGQDWEFYNPKIISHGGGIFERESAEIKLSQSVKTALMTTFDQVTGEQLIQLILKAPVDMLFNGGIGTYIKAGSETNSDANDMQNDTVRINANEVRAKIIVEGGNLGVSPTGRVEFALNGGLINTDAIDNSAGVDLSDHEVNFKILLHILMEKGIISTYNDRNKFLKNMAKEMVDLVLKNNFRQNWSLVYLQHLPDSEKKYILPAIKLLSENNLWDDTAENLKNKSVIKNCIENNLPIPVPILAVVHSSFKIYLDKKFSLQIEDKYHPILENYFPRKMGEFRDILPDHPLKNEIIKMMLVNVVADLTGFTGIIKAIHNINLHVNSIIFFNTNIYEVLDILSLKINRYLPNLDSRKLPVSVPLDVTLKIKFIKECAIYNFIEMVVLFERDILDISDKIDLPVISGKYSTSEDYPELKEILNQIEMNEIFQLSLIELRFALKYLVINSMADEKEIQEIYFDFHIDKLKNELYSISPTNNWEIQSLGTLKKLFWNGLFTTNFQNLKATLETLNLSIELKNLKDQNQLNLSTLTGIMSYLFV
jgi:glutamate dehydrogenase